MVGNQKSRASAERWSLQQAAVWIETHAGIPKGPIHRRIAPATVQELHRALKSGTITSSGCVDGGERRDISPAEWHDYRLKLKHEYVMGLGRMSIITALSIRSLPAAALKYHGHPFGVRIPSASSKDGEPGYHRVITDVRLPPDQVEQQWSASDRAPAPNDCLTGLPESKGTASPSDEQSRCPSTVGHESAAIKALGSQLESKPDLTRAEAATWCSNAGYKLSARGFQNRVWPKAREKAKLPAKAPPGRKKKSLR